MDCQEIEILCSQFGISHLMYMTHIENIRSILQEGLLCYNIVNTRCISHKSIADSNIQRRRGTTFCIVDGDLTQTDIHEYVPFFIAKHTPMQYVITTSAPTKGRYAIIRNEDLAFLLIDLVKVMQIPGMLIADGNAAVNATRFFSSPADLSELNWDEIRSPNEYPQCYDREWKRRKSAEILVPKQVPITYICGFAVFSQQAKTTIVKSIASSLGQGPESHRLTESIVIDKSYYL